MARLPFALALLLMAGAGSAEVQNSNVTGGWCAAEHATCGLHEDDGPWMAMLQQWALSSPEPGRHGRIMALPPAQGYYVTDRIDGPMLAPPPPPPQHAPLPAKHPNYPRPYDEWQHAPPSPPTTGKIVNRPPNPYKDQFKPSHPVTIQNQPIPVHGATSVDRVDENRPPPQKQVTEIDLHLLTAIEKLVYRADLMEKRMRKMEETVHYLLAGVDTEPEPCVANYTRVGSGCYHFSKESANWKGANYGCRRLKGNMLEIDSDQERDTLASKLLSDKKTKGGDFWTGGLNPGLLWIWSHSARPVLSNSTEAAHSIAGEGRCLAWLLDAAAARYVYRGEDCGARRRYICEAAARADQLSNEVDRLARKLREGRKPKILWTDDEP